MILTAEAESLPTDEKEFLDAYGLVGCQSCRSNDLSVHVGIDSSGYVRLLWESDDDRNGHAAIFEVKLGKKTERTTTESRERSDEQLFDTLESVALAVGGSDLGTTEDPLEPTARCINDTKKRQLVTRSGLPRFRCCACHLHHKWAVKSPAKSIRDTHLNAGFTLIFLPVIIRLSFTQQMILIVASWLFFHGKTRQAQNHEKTLEQY